MRFSKPVLPSYLELKKDINNILSNGLITNGKYVEYLEDLIKDYLGVRNVISVSNCTSGLIISIKSLNLPEGSEVILPSFTFLASALGVYWNNLKLKFVDVDKNTFLLNIDDLKEKININTSAVLGVHQFGNPLVNPDLFKLCEEKKIKLFFDSAHALGASSNHSKVGDLGCFEVFSLSPTKIITSGEGGIISTNDDDLAERIRRLRNYGLDHKYNCDVPGLNARMTEFEAIVGIHSFKNIENNIRSRNFLASVYIEELLDIDGIKFQKISSDSISTYKDFCILHKYRNKIIKLLNLNNIEYKICYDPSLHNTTKFRTNDILPNTEYLEKHILCLPMYPDLTDMDIYKISRIVKFSLEEKPY